MNGSATKVVISKNASSAWTVGKLRLAPINATFNILFFEPTIYSIHHSGLTRLALDAGSLSRELGVANLCGLRRERWA